MSNITSAMVKELREKTSAGMMDCKKALDEANGDIEAAVDWLRKKGLAAAQKKAGRVAAEGLVTAACAGTTGALVEVNAETDFVARNDQFQDFVRAVGPVAVEVKGDIDALKAAGYPGGAKSVDETLTDLVAKIGENMNLRRSAFISVNQGVVVSYIHGAVSEGLGRIGVLVALESSASHDVLEPLGKQIAMHAAAASPTALTIADVDAAELDRERKVLREQALASGKPEEFVDKMVEGRIRKYYEEVVLEEQVFVVDGKSKVKEFVAEAAKEAGADIKIAGFIRFVLGEGLEKKEEDFAAEVAAQLSK